MYERFTDLAFRAFVLAQEYARTHQQEWIGTEHILLGLVAEEEGIAAEVLHEHGLTLDSTWVRVLERRPEGERALGGHIQFADGAKLVIEMALRESMEQGVNYIDTEHILLGVSREGEGLGAAILGEVFGADALQTLRREVIAKVAARPKEEVVGRGSRRPVAPTRISVGADDLFRSRTFYEALGLSMHETEDRCLIAQLPDGCELELVPSSRRRRITGLQMRFQVEGLERVADALAAAGHGVEVAAEGHARIAIVEDPDQNTVILIEKLALAA